MLTGQKVQGRKVRHLRIRARVIGTAERPRLAVFRSLNHIYAQVVDDTTGRTLASVDSRAPDFRQKAKAGGNVAAAKIVVELLAQRAKARGITQVGSIAAATVHGRVKAWPSGARRRLAF